MVSCGTMGNSKGWTCGAGAGVVGCCGGLWIECVVVVDNVVQLWIDKSKTRVHAFYPKRIIPKRTSVLYPRPTYLIPFSTISQIKNWKLFSSKKIG